MGPGSGGFSSTEVSTQLLLLPSLKVIQHTGKEPLGPEACKTEKVLCIRSPAGF